MSKGILLIELDQESKNKLISTVKPIYPVVFCDHVTLFYGAEESQFGEFVGKKVYFKAISNCWNDSIQAVLADIDNDLPKNRISHVTASAVTSIRPAMSGQMLLSEHKSEPLNPPLELSGEIKFRQFDK